jgi:hypothetical protein
LFQEYPTRIEHLDNLLERLRYAKLTGKGHEHAAQGDGEICGTGVEISTKLTFKFDVLKNKAIEWPRIESKQEIMTAASARPLEDAIRLAFRELISWLHKDYGFSAYDAYMLLSLTANARIVQIVDPSTLSSLSFPKNTSTHRSIGSFFSSQLSEAMIAIDLNACQPWIMIPVSI